MSAPYEHVVSVSGGKDSTATYLLALERGRPFRAVFADTGNEHEWTYDFVRELPGKTGGPAIEWVKADLSKEIARKRAYVAAKWPEQGIPQEKVDRTVAMMVPTGNAFLDLSIWKLRFPSTKARFCTEELKIRPMWEGVQLPIIESGRALISWQGVRADESRARALLPKWQKLMPPYGLKISEEVRAGWRSYAYRPLLTWTREDVFAFHAKHGIEPNPLYAKGFSRVGCMPCIMSSKDEVRTIAARFPEHIERIAEWERLLADISKNSMGTFMPFTSDPAFKAEPEKYRGRGGYTIHDRVEWSRTSQGGRQGSLLLDPMVEFNTPCSQWGTCES